MLPIFTPLPECSTSQKCVETVGNLSDNSAFRYTAGYTESLNGLMKLLARQGRGFSFEVIRAKALLTRGCRKDSRPAYGEQWYHADVSHDTYSPDADIANLTARAIARPNGSGTPLPTAFTAPATVKEGNSKSSGNP